MAAISIGEHQWQQLPPTTAAHSFRPRSRSSATLMRRSIRCCSAKVDPL
jgi:hypothetical protein